jgi:hypothetical protein
MRHHRCGNFVCMKSRNRIGQSNSRHERQVSAVLRPRHVRQRLRRTTVKLTVRPVGCGGVPILGETEDRALTAGKIDAGQKSKSNPFHF